MMVYRLLIFLCLSLLPFTSNATHLMGGEITWACQGNGSYIFTLKLYRDCQGVPLQFPISLRVHNHPSVTGIPLQLVSQTDISPQCNGSLVGISCENGSVGAVEEFVFNSNPINLAGTPPPEGWIFTFDDCCRNTSANLVINPTETGFTLRAIMYPYNGSDNSPCFDSSPVFAQLPSIVICTGNPFTYNHNAFDVDKDSLVYSFAQPLEWLNGDAFVENTTPVQIPWYPAFNVNSPFDSPSNLDPQTGEIAFTPQDQGYYVTAVKVQSYRCGQLISEIFREIQIIILNCGDNNPPVITAPFQNPGTGQQTDFTTTVQAGDMVNFTMTANEDEFFLIGIQQTISVSASGGQFGANFTDPNNGCTNPPCATLNPAPPTTLQNNGQITFNWQTTCDHVAIENDCYVPSSVHTFVLSFQDDFCPAPSYQNATISVIVTAPPVVESPQFHCVDVQNDGNTTLSWTPVNDPDGFFNSYHIFSATSLNGPYSVVDSIFDINQSTYNHVASGADIQSIYYFIRTRSGCGGLVFTSPKDTLQSIYLDVNDLGAGVIDLQWNGISNPLPAGAQLPYRINRSYNPNPFEAFATSNSTSYEDNMVGCLQEIYYEVFLDDATGCVSSSNISGGPFSNDEAPEPPFVDSISVSLTSNEIFLGWQPSQSADTDGYIIYEVANGVNTPVDTVNGINNTSFTISNADPNSETVTYYVSALDECLEESVPGNQHTTMLLDFELNACKGSVTLSWNEYNAWASNPDNYLVYQSEDGSNFELVSQVSGETSTVELPNLVQGSNYCYYVQAVSTAATASSSSNRICFLADVQDLPDFTYLRNATVLPIGAAYSACIIDTSSDIVRYTVLRANFPGAVFDTIFTSFIPSGTREVDYIDYGVLTNAQSYTYKYLLIDKCDNASGISNTGRTILLRGEALDGFVNRLSWNTYEEWDGGVKNYRLFKSLDQGDSYFPIWSSETDTTFMDIVADEVDTLLQFCYYVEAIEQGLNSYGVRDTSRSNRICVIQKPTLWIPSAFRPTNFQGNNTFKGKGLYETLATNHAFSIYNRWGELLFITSDPFEPWDGTYNKVPVQTGIYVYTLKFNLPDGSFINRRGSVMVLD